jgi:hypothetical protein
MRPFRISIAAMVALLAALAFAQTPPAERAIGEITLIDSQNKRVMMKDDKAGPLAVVYTEKTSVLRVPPGETDLKKATRINISDVTVGDRLLAVGTRSDGNTVEARTLVIMSKADLAEKQKQDQEEWQKRGITGTVAAVDAAVKAFTVTVGDKKFRVQSQDKTDYRRYAADSAKFSDSVPSSLADLKTGDQIRVLGDKNEEALTMKAERVVAGTFQRVVGTISSINQETGEIKLTDLVNQKPFQIHVTARATIRQLPPAIANMIAQRLLPSVQGAGGQGNAPQGAALAAFRASGADPTQLLDRLPALSLADLKQGNAIVVNGSPGSDATHLTAVTVISGLEPIANALPNLLREVIGGWNLGIGGDLVDLPQ